MTFSASEAPAAPSDGGGAAGGTEHPSSRASVHVLVRPRLIRLSPAPWKASTSSRAPHAPRRPALPLRRRSGGCPLTAPLSPRLARWLGVCRLKRAKVEHAEASVSPVLHVRGLPDDCTEPELLALAQRFGPVSEVMVMVGKGQGFAQYVTSEAAMVAVQMATATPGEVRCVHEPERSAAYLA